MDMQLYALLMNKINSGGGVSKWEDREWTKLNPTSMFFWEDELGPPSFFCKAGVLYYSGIFRALEECTITIQHQITEVSMYAEGLPTYLTSSNCLVGTPDGKTLPAFMDIYGNGEMYITVPTETRIPSGSFVQFSGSIPLKE